MFENGWFCGKPGIEARGQDFPGNVGFRQNGFKIRKGFSFSAKHFVVLCNFYKKLCFVFVITV
jgi:hypothetical protein